MEDTLEDSRFRDNPLVEGAPNIRFYSGFPVRSPGGHPIGTLCVIDRRPRTLDAKATALMTLLARQVSAQFELRHQRRQLREKAEYLQTFHTFFLQNLDLQCTADEHFHFREVNPAFTTVLGYSREELTSQPFSAFMHPDDVEGAMAEAARLLAEGGSAVNFEVRFRKREGGHATLSWVARVADSTFYAVARDVTAMRAQQEALRESREGLAAILDTAPDAILTMNDAGVIQSANHGAATLFGRDPTGLIGLPLATLVDLPDRWPAGVLTRVPDGDRRPTQLERAVAHRPMAPDIAVELTTGKLGSDLSEAFTCVIRDISERERLARLQAEFVSTMSHELRTPLTAIRGSLGLVAGGVTGELPGEAAEYVGLALENCDRLVRLLNDILNLEKTESGKLKFTNQLVGLTALVDTVIEANAPIGAQLRVAVRRSVESDRGDVLADPDRLTQVLTNLLANAVKFSPAGGSVEVSVTRHGHWLRTNVRDHGPGVPEAFRSRIFQRFAQADGSDSRKQGGTGLGLHIARSLVEAMRGRIGFENEPDGGASFWFDLPHVASLPHLGATTVPGARRALVCEDDPDASRLLSAVLRSTGLDAHEAPTLARARECLDRFDYALITVDLTLADGDGAELIGHLRDSPRHAGVPVVVVTGAVETSTRGLDVASVVHKPFDERALGRLVAETLSAIRRFPPRILHVEDDPFTRKVVARALPEAWEIVGVGSVSEGRRELAASRFDVVLLDRSLPDGTGEELLGLVGRAEVVLFSASESRAAIVAPIAAALVKSRDSLESLRQVIEAAVRRIPAPETRP